VKPPDSSAPPMLLLSAAVVGLVLTAWHTRGLYLADLSHLVEHVGSAWFGYAW